MINENPYICLLENNRYNQNRVMFVSKNWSISYCIALLQLTISNSAYTL